MLFSQFATNPNQIILVAQQSSEQPTARQEPSDASYTPLIITALSVFIVFILLFAGVGWCWKIFSKQSVNSSGKDSSNQKPSLLNNIDFPTEQIPIDVEFTGASQDNKFFDVKATVYVYIDTRRSFGLFGKGKSDLDTVISTLSRGGDVTVENIANALKPRSIYALKEELKSQKLADIPSLPFRRDEKNWTRVASNVKELGLTLAGVQIFSVEDRSDLKYVIEIELLGSLAARTKDFLRAGVRGIVVVSLKDRLMSHDEINEIVKHRTEQAIRKFFAKKNLKSITESTDETTLENEIKTTLDRLNLQLTINEVVITEVIGLTLSGNEVYVNDLSAVEYPIDLEFLGSSALRTKDFLRADIRGIVFVTTTHYQMSLNDIHQLVKQRASQAIRKVVYNYNLTTITQSDKRELGELENKIQESLQDVLPEFTVKKIVITEVKGSDFYNIIYPIEITLINESAVRTKDFLRANIKAIAFVSLESEREEKNRVTNFISEDGTISKEILTKDVKIWAESVFIETSRMTDFDKIASCLCDDVPQEDSSSKSNNGFVCKVKNKLKDRLKKIGLSLKDLAIVEVDESDFHHIANNNNILDVSWSQKRQKYLMDKINLDVAIDSHNKKTQIESRRDIDLAEIEAAIAIAIKEVERLNKEKESAEIKAQIATTIKHEEAENEAFRIEKIAEAEAKQQQISINNAIAQLIAESSPHLVEILPKLAEVVKAIGTQPGVLENTHIYTLPANPETQDVSELVRSLSAYPMVIRLLQALWQQRENK
jgi:hypothetical protein